MNNVVTTIHDLIALRKEPWVAEGCKKYYKKHLKTIIEQSVILLSNSEYTKQDIINFYPEAEDKIFVTHLAASPVFRMLPHNHDFLTEYNIPNYSNYLLTVGEFQARKNHFGILTAFENVAASNSNLHLIIIGQTAKRNQVYIDTLRNKIEQSPFNDRIRLLNDISTDQLVKFYNNAMGFLYFSFYEGFGLPIIEAMQCKCPVVSSNTTSMKEIADGAALLIDPYNQESMIDATRKLVTDEQIRFSLQEAGLHRAARYSWEKTAKLTFESYVEAFKKLMPNS